MPNILQRFSLAVPLALAVGVPFVLTSESTESLRGSVGSMFATETPPSAAATGITDPEVSRLLSLSEQQLSAPVAGTERPTPVASLEGVLRFDITPQWIMDNWPHVATTRNEGGMDGLRVPLVTGTTSESVAGSLTYYFDAQHVVQRIALDGITGDERNLVGLVTRVYHLTPEPQAGVGIYVSKWNGEPTSAVDPATAVGHCRESVPEVRVLTGTKPTESLLRVESALQSPPATCSGQGRIYRRANAALKGHQALRHVLTPRRGFSCRCARPGPDCFGR